MNKGNALINIIEEMFAHGQGWLGGVIVLAISVSMPLALAQSDWVFGMKRLVVITLAGALLGLLAGRKRRPLWLWPFVALAGLALAVDVGAGIWPPFVGSGERMAEAARRISWWTQVIWAGGSTDDPLIPLVVAGWLLWMASYWLAWASVRLKNALLAALPAGVILAANTFFGLGGATFLLAFVPLTILLMMQTRLRSLEEDFQSHGTLYGETMRAHLLGWALPVIALVTAAAIFMPYLSADSLSQALWKHVEQPWSYVVRWAHWLFPGLRARGEAAPWLAAAASAAMPSARALVGEVNASDTLVMYVRTSDPPPLTLPEYVAAERLGMDEPLGPKRYWRGMTYDIYTGRGWANSRLDIVRSEPGQRLWQPPGPREEVIQQFEILVARGELLYAVADPVAVDVASRGRWRGDGDFAFINASVGKYSVISAVPKVTVKDLREAGDAYPAWVRERYLQLPDMPERVLTLAKEITAGQATAYDKLMAIQTYLRDYQYDLNVNQPAEGKDVVDYFLFEAKRGYCDYYASAMVVMARAVGIPARLASGYATGIYDYNAGYYVVRDSDAHSWPEAFFPGLGWIEFEPTAARTVFERPAGVEASLPSPSAVKPGQVLPERQALPWLVLVVLVMGATIALSSVFVLRHRYSLGDPVLMAYAGLERSGERLGLPLSESLTPREYAQSLTHYILSTAEAVGLGNGRDGVGIGEAANAIETIAVAYEKHRYAGPGAYGQTNGVVGMWKSLSRSLRRLAWRRLPLALWERVTRTPWEKKE